MADLRFHSSAGTAWSCTRSASMRVEPIGFSSSKTGSMRSVLLRVDMAQQVLHDHVHVQREQDALAQRILMKQRRNLEAVGIVELLDQRHQLGHQVLAAYP